MKSITHFQIAKANRFAIAYQCANLFNSNTQLVDNLEFQRAKSAFRLLSSEKQKALTKNAINCISVLKKYDGNLKSAKSVVIQHDKAYRSNDPRDILVETEGGEIGITSRNSSDFLKCSKVSRNFDFGKIWYDKPCSSYYWQAVNPVFDDLESRDKQFWKNIRNKHDDYYMPILRAFLDEVIRSADASKLFHYLLGGKDYYRIVSERRYLYITPHNINGRLNFGSKIHLPNRIASTYIDPKCKTRANIVFDNYWTITFQLCNPTALIQPWLMFNICILGRSNQFGLGSHYL